MRMEYIKYISLTVINLNDSQGYSFDQTTKVTKVFSSSMDGHNQSYDADLYKGFF